MDNPMVPKIMMVATRPPPNVQQVFQTHKVLTNLPDYMFEPLQNPHEIKLGEDKKPAEDERMNRFLEMSMEEKDEMTCD